MDRYNLVVIGAGSAGLTVAAGAAGLGARVALVEAGAMGGECLNTGCVPSKALLRCAQTARTKRLALHGLAAAPVATSWPAIAARVRETIAAIAPHDSAERFTGLGVDVVRGRARLVSPTAVEVALAAGGTRRLEGKALVVATGSRPAVPQVPGLAEAGFLTHETLFEALERFRPAGDGCGPRVAVLGGGPVGVELAQALARLGARVTVIEAQKRLLPREDPDAAQAVAAALREDGVAVWTGATATRVEMADGAKRLHVASAGTAPTGAEPTGLDIAATAPRSALSGAGLPPFLDVDHVLVAVGRVPQVEGLELEQAGVLADAGGVQVDAHLRTTSPSVYACGDAVGPYRFTHMAGQQARIVVQNALLPFKARIDYRVVPWCTFTDPEVARVGLGEAEARAQGIAFRTIRVDLAHNDRAVCDGQARGFLKVLTPPGRDDILGATLVGAHAGELIHEAVLAMHKRLRLRDLAAAVHVYPTLAEAFRRAGDESRKARFTPGLQTLLRGYLAWQRG
jgi:pyruvate/2-oxoglutarate dehydrogenase complex dihydrolipoamide dehydrogenase (E3) component